MRQIYSWDEHQITSTELCNRYGYRPDYYFKVGLTNAYVKIQQAKFGKNEISSFLKDMAQMTSKVFGACVS